MAELRKRNGKWMITIRNPNIVGNSKKSKTKTFDTKLDAMIWISES